MTSQFIRKTTADLRDYPGLDSHLVGIHYEITIGDLHGNALKLLYFLIDQQVLAMSKQDYMEAVTIYERAKLMLTIDDLKKFSEILSRTTTNKPVDKVRFIGDELADRGNNDYLTLKILEKLHAHSIPFEILLSNHGLEFIQWYEKNNWPDIPSYQRSSQENMLKLMDAGMIHETEIDEIINFVYKPNVKVLGYHIGDKKITLFSHAPIGLEIIRAMAKQLNVAYHDGTIKELSESIDCINAIFSEYVNKNIVHDLVQSRMAFAEVQEKMFGNPYENLNWKKFPFAYLIWSRRYAGLQCPDHYHGYTINFIHGHDHKPSGLDNVKSLDDEFGKDYNDPRHDPYMGVYQCLLEDNE
ncbi:MAG: hypothetical protein A3F42_06475 [Gammaproteobacteria bacterium RIFCSPHIGHO2_12_FULL_37_34]|nr:MAG: hypothetical protein A3F42_06475 [Gammaproteobacteria bacterium RIFCSPHIGHO2_12_FULL_37_34]